MSSRGVRQLKHIRLYFCDVGGSSSGVRTTLKSEEFVNYVNKNEHLQFEVFLKRGAHPYMSSTYINGYVKDTPLRNLDLANTMRHLDQVNSEFGRRPISHHQERVKTSHASI